MTGLKAAVQEHGLQITIRAVVNTAAADRGWALPYEVPEISDLPVISTPADLGPLYEEAISIGKRKANGVYYTPEPLAAFTSKIAIDQALATLSEIDKPTRVFDLIIVDPACGGGMLLVTALEMLATRYVELISGEPDPPKWAVRMAMPEIAYQCIFGMDIDPVAIDMTRSALWLAGDGHWMPSLLERNICVADPLAGEQPPALSERLGETKGAA